jgi:hypothetical protein
MAELGREGYARLPEDLLRDLLLAADDVVDEVDELLLPALARRDEFRAALDALGLIQTHTESPTRTLAGIDGGFAVERTAAVDLLLSVAVGVEGLSRTTTHWTGPQYDWWSLVCEHDPEADRLMRGVMAAQELAVIADAPHELRILDGSHLTLVIQLNSALSSQSQRVLKETRNVWARLKTVETLTRAVGTPQIIAMPKYDSSRSLTKQLEEYIGETIPGDDKHLMNLLLEPGEHTKLCQVPPEWSRLHFSAADDADKQLETELTDAIAPLSECAIDFTYFKPDEISPAYRIELKQATTSHDLDAILSTIAAQITGPFVREPYPQYLADVMAKSVGLGLSALQSAVQLALSQKGQPELAEMLIHSYRTEGV